MGRVAPPSDAPLWIAFYAYDGRGPRMEKAAGYLNGGGGGSIFRCLSPGPGFLFSQRGPRMEEVAGYLNGDGGSAFRCLSPGPDSSSLEGGFPDGESGRISERRWWLRLQMPSFGAHFATENVCKKQDYQMTEIPMLPECLSGGVLNREWVLSWVPELRKGSHTCLGPTKHFSANAGEPGNRK